MDLKVVSCGGANFRDEVPTLSLCYKADKQLLANFALQVLIVFT